LPWETNRKVLGKVLWETKAWKSDELKPGFMSRKLLQYVRQQLVKTDSGDGLTPRQVDVTKKLFTSRAVVRSGQSKDRHNTHGSLQYVRQQSVKTDSGDGMTPRQVDVTKKLFTSQAVVRSGQSKDRHEKHPSTPKHTATPHESGRASDYNKEINEWMNKIVEENLVKSSVEERVGSCNENVE
jgi:hypothetical protein